MIVIHEHTTLRTTGVPWTVGENTLTELRTLDAGYWKGPQFAGTPLPVLEEVLHALPDNKRLFVELKTGPEIVTPLRELLSSIHKAPLQLPLISFDRQTIALAKREVPAQECYLLVDFADAHTAPLDHLIGFVLSANLDGIDASWPHPPELAARLHDAGLRAVVWTVNDAAIARHLVASGIHSITTDLPGQIRRALDTIDR